MSLTLYIVRHGERIDQVEPSFLYISSTPYDPPLTPRGKRQAKKTGSYIYTLQQESVSATKNVEYVITTSPFARTTETAIDIAKGISTSEPNSKITFRIDPSLAEWHTSANYAQAVPDSIIEKRFKELREKSGKEGDEEYPFEVDESYTPVFGVLPKYPEGIHEVLMRCQKALTGISFPYIQQIKRDRLSNTTHNSEKLNTDIVLIIVTHGWCFNVIQEACSKSTNWREAGLCAVSRAKWVPKEDSEGDGIPDIQITNVVTDEDEGGEKSEIQRKNEEAVNALNAVNPDGKWNLDVISNTDHLKGI